MSESRKAFESHVNQYDTFGDEWQDKGVDEHFISGYEAGKAARAGQESEPFAFCFTDVNGKPSEFCDHPKHAAEGDTRIRTPLYTHPVSAAKQAVSVPGDEYIRALQDLVIKQGEMLSAIVNIVKGPPAENSLHSTHDVVEGVRKLNALVWGGDKEVFVLRKQAEAIDYVLSDIEIMLWHGVEFVAVSNIEYYANTLRAEANAEGDTNED